MILVYTLLNLVTKTIQANSQNPPEGASTSYSPKFLPHNWTGWKELKSSRASHRLGRCTLAVNHTIGKVRPGPFPRYSEVHKMNASFVTPTQPFSIESQGFSLLKPVS